MDEPRHPIADQLARLAAQSIDSLSREACLLHLADLATVTRFVQGLHTRFAARLDQVSPTPEADHAAATRESKQAANQATRRSRGRGSSGAAGVALGKAMDHGVVSGEHLDVFLSVQSTLLPDVRDLFCASDERITQWATTLDVEGFRRALQHLADDLRRQHGINRLEQQKRNTSVRIWVDLEGMVRLQGTFDPESGVLLRSALAAMLETLHAGPTPEYCPADPVARQDFLRAHALLRLLEHGPACQGQGRGRAELVIIADTTRLDEQGRPSIDWGLPVELPLESLANFYERVERTTIIDVLAQGTIRDLTPMLHLGRSTRLANRAQRRVLRALHPTCVVPGCQTPFDRCHIHHVQWWRHGGTTDLANLAPLCTPHHDRVHNHGWTLSIDRQRRVTITLPEGVRHQSEHVPPWFDLAAATVPSLGP